MTIKEMLKALVLSAKILTNDIKIIHTDTKRMDNYFHLLQFRKKDIEEPEVFEALKELNPEAYKIYRNNLTIQDKVHESICGIEVVYGKDPRDN